MDIITKIALPKEVYQFYANASAYISQRTPEEVMADALDAYSRMLRNGSRALQEDAERKHP